MNRRTFIAGLGGAAAWPIAARAQQPAMPHVSYLQFGQTQGDLNMVDAVPVPNMEQVPAAVAAQVQRKVAVIYGTLGVALVAKAITSTIPIVFATTDDPVTAGAVGSYSRPGANVTGVRLRAGDENTKLFQLLHELVPIATTIGVLMHRAGVMISADIEAVEAAARSMGVSAIVIPVSDEGEFAAAFVSFADAKVGAVFVSDHRYFDSRVGQIIDLAKHTRLPLVSIQADYAVAGALASYGADFNDSIRQAGNYVGRILKGEKPADLPVLQPTKFRFTINLKTAKTLGLNVPELLLLRADEVIE